MALPAAALAALITGGSGLLSGLIGGASAGAEKKKDRKYQEQQNQKMLGLLKPQGQRYENPFLPALTDTMMRATVGNLGSRMSPDMLSKWGINIEDLQKVLGFNQPYSQGPAAQQFYGGQGMGNMQGGGNIQRPMHDSPIRHRLMERYGGMPDQALMR